MSSVTRPRRSVNRADNEEDDIILTSKGSLTNKDTDVTKGRRCKFLCKTILLLVRNITVEPVMFLFMFGTYLYLALIELYIYQQYGLKALKNASFNMPNHSFCVNATFLDQVVGNGTNDRVESEASLLILTISATGQVISVFVALVAGPLSDRYGRKPMLLFALSGNLIGAVLNIFIVYFHLDMHSLIASGLVLGITGGFSVVMTVCVAYVADVSTTKWLTLRIALLQSMLYISQALSDVITGQWLKRSGCFFDPLLWLSAAAGLLVLLYLIILREPWSREARLAKLKAKGEEQIASLLTRGFRIFLYRGYSRWRLWLTLITMSITVINGIGMFEILTLFQVHEPLNWDPAEIGWYGLASTLAQAFSLFFILPVIVFLRIPDPLIVLVGLVITSGMYFFIGFLRESWEMYLVGVLLGLDPTITPIIRAILSKLVLQKDQGALFAIVTAVQVLSAAFSSVLYNTVFRELLRQHLHPGLVFILMGILGLLPVPLMLILFIFRKGAKSSQLKELDVAKQSDNEGVPVSSEEEDNLLSDDT